MNEIINTIENSLLCDLLELYSGDLKSQLHQIRHNKCSACAKQRLIAEITSYKELCAAESEWCDTTKPRRFSYAENNVP